MSQFRILDNQKLTNFGEKWVIIGESKRLLVIVARLADM